MLQSLLLTQTEIRDLKHTPSIYRTIQIRRKQEAIKIQIDLLIFSGLQMADTWDLSDPGLEFTNLLFLRLLSAADLLLLSSARERKQKLH